MGKSINSAQQQILDLMMPNPEQWWSGMDICRATRLPSGRVTQETFKINQWGWLEDTWEDEEEARNDGRPPLHFYRISGSKRGELQRTLEQARAPRRSFRPGTAPA